MTPRSLAPPVQEEHGGVCALCIGEIALDLIRVRGASTPPVFEGYLGGSTVNVAAGLRASGVDARVCSRVGRDSAGEAVLKELRALGLSTDLVRVDPDHATRILFIDQEDPNRPIRLQTPDSADMHLRPDDVPASSFAGCRLLYASGAALLAETSAGVVESVLKRFDSDLRRIIAFDPNVSLGNTPASDRVRERIQRIVSLVHVLQVSDHRLRQYWPNSSVEDVAGRVALLIHTRGPQGVELYTNGRIIVIPAKVVEVVDPTGAGDAFLASFLSQVLSQSDFPRGFPTDEDLLRWGLEAVVAASHVLRTRGATTHLRIEGAQARAPSAR